MEDKSVLNGTAHEGPHHDCKRTFDHTSQRAMLDLVKDIVAIANCGGGALTFGRTGNEIIGLTDDACNALDSAVKVLGDETLKTIAQELVKTVRANVTIDWTVRENVRAQLRVYVKRILRKYGYPPDKQEKATLIVLEQAEALSEGWATS